MRLVLLLGGGVDGFVGYRWGRDVGGYGRGRGVVSWKLGREKKSSHMIISK